MKKIILLLLAICCIGWYSVPTLKKLGVVKTAKTASLAQSNFILPDPEPPVNKPAACITLVEYTEQVKTDPNAYYKLLQCEQPRERTSFDKLMNLFSHAKYE